MKVKLRITFVHGRTQYDEKNERWKFLSLEDIFQIFREVCEVRSWEIKEDEDNRFIVFINADIEPMSIDQFLSSLKKHFFTKARISPQITLKSYQLGKREMSKYKTALVMEKIEGEKDE